MLAATRRRLFAVLQSTRGVPIPQGAAQSTALQYDYLMWALVHTLYIVEAASERIR